MKVEVAIVGGGAIGLSIAYSLAEKGKKVAVFEGGYLGYGATGRSQGSVKERWEDEALAKLASRGLKLHETLPGRLGVNTFLNQGGILALAMGEEELKILERAHEAHRRLGLPCRWMGREEIGRRFPYLNTAQILGGCFDRREGLVHPLSLIWAYRDALTRRGCPVMKLTPVEEIKVKDGHVTGLTTGQGEVETGIVVLATGAYSRGIEKAVGVNIPLKTVKREMMVTEPMKPFLNTVIERPSNSYRIGQTMRGEMIATINGAEEGGDLGEVSFEFLRRISLQTVELLPTFRSLKVLRQWVGLYDASPDDRPILGEAGVRGVYVACGHGDFGVTVAPAVGELMANLIAEGRTDPLLEKFKPSRFA